MGITGRSETSWCDVSSGKFYHRHTWLSTLGATFREITGRSGNTKQWENISGIYDRHPDGRPVPSYHYGRGMTWAFVLSTILFGALWGIMQGMCMIQPRDIMSIRGFHDPDLCGPRRHVWFRWYHQGWIITLAVFAAVILIGERIIPQGYYMLMAGAGFIGWEASELAYNWTRYRTLFMKHENVFGILPVDNKVLAIHIFRTLSGTILLTKGVL